VCLPILSTKSVQIGKCHSDEYPNTEGRETEKRQIGAVSEEADGAQTSSALHGSPSAPRGSCFQTPGLYTFITGAAERMPENLFFPTPQEGFCKPRASCSFSSTAAVPAVPTETTGEDRPLTSPPLRPALGGEPYGEVATPWTQTGSKGQRSAARCVQSAPYTVNCLAPVYT
jgi:hypothetical protein